MRVVLGLLLIVAGSCAEGGGAPLQCEDEWCQGIPTGSWSFDPRAACLVEPVSVPVCPELSCTLESVEVSGSMVFPSGGAGASADYGFEGTLACTVPRSCLAGPDCSELAAACEASAQGCSCEVPLALDVAIAGVWTADIDKGLLEIRDEATGSSWSTRSYCHGETSLELMMVDMPNLSAALGSIPVRLRAHAIRAG